MRSKHLLFGLDLFIKKAERLEKKQTSYGVITLSAWHYLCALERKRVEESQRESLRKHVGAFLTCLQGDHIQPGWKEWRRGRDAKARHE